MNAENLTGTASPSNREAQTSEPFSVHDAKSANWVVRKVMETRAYAQHVKEWAEAEMRRADQEERFYLHRYGHQLQAWLKSQLNSGRRKCVKLPAGTLGFRNEPIKLDVVDEKSLVGWCQKSLPGALCTQVRVLKSLVKDHFRKTGELPDGMITTGGCERFYVR
jgi:hypothetical protein